jgi:predicted nucleic acid-binding protein
VTVFVDTSAFYALLSASDSKHAAARSAWSTLRQQRATLLTSNYVLVETTALIQHRLGRLALREVQTAFLPLLSVAWIDQATHARAMSVLLAVAARDLRLVDCTSFEVMRHNAVQTAFAFDAHFSQQGFQCMPLSPD